MTFVLGMMAGCLVAASLTPAATEWQRGAMGLLVFCLGYLAGGLAWRGR